MSWRGNTLPRGRNARVSTQARQRSARKMMARAFRGAASTRKTWARSRRVMSGATGRPEIKLVDGLAGTPGANTLTLDTAGRIQPVNLIASGSGFNNRIGRKIEMQSLHLHGVLTQTGTATTTTDYTRIVVVYDRQTNGAVPVLQDIFTNYSQSSVTSSTVFSDLNPDERERFQILADYRVVLPATTAAGTTGASDGLQPTFII